MTIFGDHDSRMQIRIGRNAVLSNRELEAAGQAYRFIVPSLEAPNQFVATESGNTMRIVVEAMTNADLDHLFATTRFCSEPA